MGPSLTEYGDGHWRATFYVTGIAHSIVGGSAWEATPWGDELLFYLGPHIAYVPRTKWAQVRRDGVDSRGSLAA